VTFVSFINDPFTVNEPVAATITLTRTGITSGTSNFTVTPSNGTATGGPACGPAGVDFVNTPLNGSFPPGATSASVVLQTCGDTQTEPTETVNLLLTGADTRPSSDAPGAPEVDNAVLNIRDTANQFRNPAAICTTLGGPADVYPSPITVAGGPVQIGGIRVTLYDFYHQFPDNVDVLLVGPLGQKFVIMGDSGGAVPIDQNSPVTLTFRDTQPQVLPNSGPLVSGVFEPTTWESPVTSFPAPAPPAPYVEPGSTVGGAITFFSTYGITSANGIWNLYVRDDAGLFQVVNGCVGGGWGLEFLQSTAANAAISGRVMTSDGVGIRNARMTLTGGTLSEPRQVVTGSMGYYSFDELEVGQTYILTINSRRYTFQVPNRVISLVDNINDADFIADAPAVNQ